LEARWTQEILISSSLTQRRLLSQRLVAPRFKAPADVVSWLAAVQAQDYAGAKWALGTRMPGSTDADVEAAFASGAILRTHILRPTWHFITPADIRWLLALTAPRVHAANARIYRKYGLDTTIFRRSNALLERALQGRRYLTRDELRMIFERRRIPTDEIRMAFLLMWAELEGLICSGPRRGKQFTYALLDERVPATKALGRDAALAELARRFFTSRGPATIHDFAKWAGLTLADGRRGVDAAGRALVAETVEGTRYWLAPSSRRIPRNATPTAHLISIFDEYVSGYRDRSAIMSAARASRLYRLGPAGTSIVVVNGMVVGRWTRTFARDAVSIRIQLFDKLKRAERRALESATERFGAFVGLPVALKL
jgi:winged helix DNA-binding protein